MQYKKLTPNQKAIKRWREKRNSLVQKLLDENPHFHRHDALRAANHEMAKSRPKSKGRTDIRMGKHEQRINRLLALLRFAQPYTAGELRKQIDDELSKKT